MLKALGGLAAAGLAALTFANVPVATASTTAGIRPAASVPAAISGPARLTAPVAATVQGTGLAAKQAALAGYWTAARMKAAQPDSQMPSVAALASRTPRTGSTTRAAGPATRIAGTTSAAAAITPKAAGRAIGHRVIKPQSFYPNLPVGSPVARTSGKVFFTSFGVNYVCSGTIVNTEGKSTVWTAGHCVSEGGAWNYNWVFVPNYANGSAPYGVWTSNRLTTTSAWFGNNNDLANDVGASTMNRNAGRRIADYLGGQGIAWNYNVGGYYMYAFGYPQASPFTGCCLVESPGNTFNGGGGTIYMANTMTGGSSGGAWLNWFDGNWGYINGHNDFKYNSSPQNMYSPYYGNQVAAVYNAVRNIST